MLLVNWGYIRGQAMTMAFNPAQLPDTKLRRLYEYWCSRCQGGALPSRRDTNPLALHDLLPNLFLLDVIGEDRKRVVTGKSGSVSVDLGGSRRIKKKKSYKKERK